jgi:hypothetical protein
LAARELLSGGRSELAATPALENERVRSAKLPDRLPKASVDLAIA